MILKKRLMALRDGYWAWRPRPTTTGGGGALDARLCGRHL